MSMPTKKPEIEYIRIMDTKMTLMNFDGIKEDLKVVYKNKESTNEQETLMFELVQKAEILMPMTEYYQAQMNQKNGIITQAQRELNLTKQKTNQFLKQVVECFSKVHNYVMSNSNRVDTAQWRALLKEVNKIRQKIGNWQKGLE